MRDTHVVMQCERVNDRLMRAKGLVELLVRQYNAGIDDEAAESFGLALEAVGELVLSADHAVAELAEHFEEDGAAAPQP